MGLGRDAASSLGRGRFALQADMRELASICPLFAMSALRYVRLVPIAIEERTFRDAVDLRAIAFSYWFQFFQASIRTSCDGGHRYLRLPGLKPRQRDIELLPGGRHGTR
jgi:hypothetical protein